VNKATKQLIIFGVSNMLSDIFDSALANGLCLKKVVIHLPEEVGERDVSLAERIRALQGFCDPPVVEQLQNFRPQAGEIYLLGPTTPTRAALAQELEKFGIEFFTLTHPTAYISPLAKLGRGVFIGANSVIAPGVVLDDHVFVNRGVTIGHDTRISSFSRIQPGSNLGSMSRIGCGVTVGIGATVRERLHIGDGAVIGAGAVVLEDVPPRVLVAGIPAKFKKAME
jgi:sugar O-acyltransferase (sialic acid O-acetyltransferase NeuD family)